MYTNYENDPSVDDYLIEKCKKGDRAAFDRLLDKYESRIYNFAYRISGNHEEASDITLEAFIRAFNSIKSFRRDAAFSSWMYRIVKNVFLDRRKINEKHNHISLNESYETDHGYVQRDVKDESTPSPEDTLLSTEKRELIMNMLSELPDHHRIPLIMYYSEGMAYEDIAKALDLPIGTVKSRINRARTTLTEKIHDKAEQL